jgi:hypothetical protein
MGGCVFAGCHGRTGAKFAHVSNLWPFKGVKETMLNLRVILGFVMIVCVSCREGFDQNEAQARYCGVNDPVSEIDWLRTEAEELQRTTVNMDAFIFTANYRNERVFYTNICCPSCSILPPEVRNCEGASLGRLGDDVDPAELVGTAMLWRTLNGVCD